MIAVQRVNHAIRLHKNTGESNPSAKLTEKQVREIRYRYETEIPYPTQKELAYEFRVSQKEISLIVNRKLWRHVI